MADYSELIAVELGGGVQTAIPAAGIAAGSAGTYTLNICNDSDAAAAIDAICITKGGAPVASDKVHPAFTIEPRGWAAIQPIKLGEGWKVFVTSSAVVSAQLIGRKEG